MPSLSGYANKETRPRARRGPRSHSPAACTSPVRHPLANPVPVITPLADAARPPRPEKSDQAANRKRKGSADGRPPAFDGEAYKGRDVVERGFNRLKNWRGPALRSDKTAGNYLAAVQLAASLVWLKASFSNTP